MNMAGTQGDTLLQRQATPSDGDTTDRRGTPDVLTDRPDEGEQEIQGPQDQRGISSMQRENQRKFDDAFREKSKEPEIINDEYKKIHSNFLGLVGKSNQFKNLNGTGECCEADHIPPVQVFKNIWKSPANKEIKPTDFQKEYNVINEKIDLEEKIIENMTIRQWTEQEIKEMTITKTNLEKKITEYTAPQSEEYKKMILEDNNLEEEITKKIMIVKCKKQEIQAMIKQKMILEEKITETMITKNIIAEQREREEIRGIVPMIIKDINLKGIIFKIKTTERFIAEKKALEDMKTRNKELYNLIAKKGIKGLCKRVLKLDHEKGLTYKRSDISTIISKKLQEIFIAGDVEKLMKMSMIAANPVMSELIKKSLGLKSKANADDDKHLSQEARKWYHDLGNQLLVEEYYNMKIINYTEKGKILEWCDKDLYSTETSEYKELYHELKSNI